MLRFKVQKNQNFSQFSNLFCILFFSDIFPLLTTMSADMFAPQKTTATPTTNTKIPVPSPTPLRRSASLRIRGEIAPSRAANPLHNNKHHNPGVSGGGGGGGALMDAAKSRPIIRTPGASPRMPQSPARNRSLVSE